MELRYVKYNPTGNTTILVLDPVPRNRQGILAKKLMQESSLCAEQVGYVEAPSNPKAYARLQMMGGEFCANASRCLASWITKGENGTVSIEVSGHLGLLTATVQKKEEPHITETEIEMPLPMEIRSARDETLGAYSVVYFEGILHIVLWERTAAEDTVSIAIDFLKDMGLPVDTFGVLFYDEKTANMIPVISVEAINSLVWEQSCGSGTVAVGVALAERYKTTLCGLKIHQPGGTLTVSVEREERITVARLSGDIAMVAVGTVFIDKKEAELW